MAPWIKFDGLGITINGIQRSFTVFGIEIYWYGVIIAVGFLLAAFLALRKCDKFGFSKDDLLTYIIVGTPVAIIFARVYFFIFSLEKYSSFWEIFNIRGGGLAIYGGVIGIIAAAFVMTRIKKQSIIKLFDLALPYVLIGQAIGRWGNFVNQEAYGRATDLPWRMSGSDIPGSVHPDFLYESLWCVLIFFLIMLYSRKFRKNDGELMCLYFVGYGIGRAFIESIRGDDALLIFGQRVSMWLSVILVLAFGALFVYFRFFRKAKVVAAAENAAAMENAKTGEAVMTGEAAGETAGEAAEIEGTAAEEEAAEIENTDGEK